MTILSALFSMGMADMATTSAYAGGASVCVAVAGFFVLRSMRRQRLRRQLLAIGVLIVATIVVGVVVAARVMFLSSHDLSVLFLQLGVSSIVAVLASLYLGRAFERSVADVTTFASTLSEPGVSTMPSRPLMTGELKSLADRLGDVSSELEASRQRERSLDAARRELVAWVSHDLRSPIASVRAMAEALEDGVVDDADGMHRYHRAIKQESERLGTLVDDLFEMSRINAGAFDQRQPFVPLSELIVEVLDVVEPTAVARGLAVVCPIDELPNALVPSADLGRVLRNLLDNALRHTRVGGTITVDAMLTQPGVIELSVTDECGGIPADELPRVFDVAFRGDAARTRDRAGGGLGLAIAKGLIEAHDGSLAVVNRGEGCRFAAHLPVVVR